MANNDYPYIRAWGHDLGSSPAYIAEQIEQARRDRAPADAIYRDHDTRQWRTAGNITAQGTRLRLGLPPLGPADPAVMDKYKAVIAEAVVTETVPDGTMIIEFPSVRAVVSWAEEYRLLPRVRVLVFGRSVGLSETVLVTLAPETKAAS